MAINIRTGTAVHNKFTQEVGKIVDHHSNGSWYKIATTDGDTYRKSVQKLKKLGWVIGAQKLIQP